MKNSLQLREGVLFFAYWESFLKAPIKTMILSSSKFYTFWALVFVTTMSFIARSETSTSGGGRGGPFIEYHANSLTGFDPGVTGSPVVIGGIGYAWVTPKFRLGGGGGGGFLWNGSDNLAFGMGYGGVVGEYVIGSWFNARLLIGGGGYSIAKITFETDSNQIVQKLNSGGFIVFHPSVNAEIKIYSWASLALTAGYFLPNVGRLHSFTAGVNLLFGTTRR